MEKKYYLRTYNHNVEMQQKDIHIVFGLSSRGTLRASGEIREEGGEIICMQDVLAYGPLVDISSSAADVHRRKEWLSEVWFADRVHEVKVVDEDAEIITSLAGRVSAADRIYLWTGYAAGEILGTARLLSHLPEREAEIYMADFPNEAVTRRDGSTMYPDSLAVTAPEQVGGILRRFRRVGEDELPRWKAIWREAMSEGAMLRILDREGKPAGVDVSYPDPLLTRRCTGEFQKAARIIGYTLCDLFDLGIVLGDAFLNWRMKHLVAEGRLRSRGVMSHIRDYEVCLPVPDSPATTDEGI